MAFILGFEGGTPNGKNLMNVLSQMGHSTLSPLKMIFLNIVFIFFGTNFFIIMRANHRVVGCIMYNS